MSLSDRKQISKISQIWSYSFKPAVQNFCLPPLAVRIITKTLPTYTNAYSIATVVAVKQQINCFWRHTTSAKWLVSLS